MTNDIIADMLTRLRNANRINKKTVLIPKTKMTIAIAQILQDEGFIESITNGFATNVDEIQIGRSQSDKVTITSTPNFGGVNLEGAKPKNSSQQFYNADKIQALMNKNEKFFTITLHVGNGKTNWHPEAPLQQSQSKSEIAKSTIKKSTVRGRLGSNVGKTNVRISGSLQKVRGKKNNKKSPSLSTNYPTLVNLKKISKPGCRIYVNSTTIPKVLGGIGIAIISTSKGIMPDRIARQEKIGGELLCYIY